MIFVDMSWLLWVYPESLGQRALRDILMSRGLGGVAAKSEIDSQLPSPKLSPKMPPKLSLPHNKKALFLFQNYPSVRVSARQWRDKIVAQQLLSRDIKMSVLAHWLLSQTQTLPTPKNVRELIWVMIG